MLVSPVSVEVLVVEEAVVAEVVELLRLRQSVPDFTGAASADSPCRLPERMGSPRISM